LKIFVKPLITASVALLLKDPVYLLAVIHAGGEYERDRENLSDSQRVIGWRNGMYCVLPSLLLEIKPCASSVGLVCKDIWYANVRVHSDGWIRSSVTAAMYSQNHSQQENPDQQSVIEITQSPWIGPAHCSPPNKLLYLSIERSLHYGDPDVCFTGRVDGNFVGTTSVPDVLVSVARSVSMPSECDHRDLNNISNVLNVSASQCIKDRYSKPWVGRNPSLFSCQRSGHSLQLGNLVISITLFLFDA
jgi:hypothetical protein